MRDIIESFKNIYQIGQSRKRSHESQPAISDLVQILHKSSTYVFWNSKGVKFLFFSEAQKIKHQNSYFFTIFVHFY